MLQFIRANAWVVVVAALAVVGAFLAVEPVPPRHIVLATGTEGGAYHEFGRRLATELARDGFTLELRPTQGSIENLQLLAAADNDVALALVQTGIAGADTGAALHTLGSLFYEPFWVFVRRDAGFTELRQLRGRRLAIGAPGSGTQPVALRALELNGIPAGGALRPLGGREAITALRNGEVAAACFVGAPTNAFIRELLDDSALDFLNVRRARAYQAAFPRLQTITLGEGQLDLARNLPAEDRTMLSAVVTLVANERFHPGLTPLVLGAAVKLLRDGGTLERPGEFPAARPAEFPLLPGAEHYHSNGPPFLMRYLPFWAATIAFRAVILLVPLLVLLVPLLRIAPPIYTWRMRHRIYRWYRHLREIDQNIHAGKLGDSVEDEIARLRRLEDEILALKVPLSYADELYDLHLHIEWVIRRLERVRTEGGTRPATDA